ncbi:fatty acid ABC transporter ATP-binding/permease protein-like [Periplaneta americana]|uniref:fatty acid ABC transporter ATP-binding/permease protein-like n=1 Tax=Periplaneta americana TaxID=6978 RepID=UPI0037E84B6E
MAPKARAYQKAYMQQMGQLNNHVEESYNGQMIIKSFNGEEKYLQQFQEYNAPLYQGWKVKFLVGMMMPLMLAIKNLGYVLVAVAGGWKVATGRISIGDIQAFLQYTSQFTQPVADMAGIVSNLLSTVASAERVFEILDQPDMPETINSNQKKIGHQKIDFENVQFGYHSTEPIIQNFNLSVKSGEMVAIVGHTGAGKTTLINLLERFYDVQKGAIYMDGVDLRAIPDQELHRRIAMVLQDVWMFSGTIYDNIVYGNRGITQEQFKNVTQATYVEDFVNKMPHGYQTLLNESATNISQGQCQLISIARALMTNPEVLILDEATSNVDTRTELLIQKALKNLMQGRTSFIIAHRLSTIQNADKILVMEKGSIVEVGNHEELLTKNGVYAEIYHSQFLNQAV